MRTLASLGMGEGQLCSCAVVVLCCSWRWAVLELMSQLLFFWRRDVKKWEGEGEGIGYCRRVCCWRRMNE